MLRVATAAEIGSIGTRALAIQGDVKDPESADAVVKTVLDAFGKVDILVNNAGITRDDLIMRMTEDAWRDVLETNLFGAFWMTKAVTRPMLKARGGRIVNITSVVGVTGNAGQVNYAASKAGVIGLTRSVAKELASRGVCVNAVAPGLIATDMTSALEPKAVETLKSRVPLGRIGEAEEIAAAVDFLCGPGGAYITGQTLIVDGGLSL